MGAAALLQDNRVGWRTRTNSPPRNNNFIKTRYQAMKDIKERPFLPLREDGSIYGGVLTFTASEPVKCRILNVQNLNETERAILNVLTTRMGGQLDTLLTAALDNQTRLALTIVTPPYGDSPVPSASLPFAGNALWLHTAEDAICCKLCCKCSNTSARDDE